ncbi:platelet basic protein-like isoform X1 [Rana temporaria]|uniref:platelet basic protein-like isoform X1 n=1 Tax=Rana temporaria TaxID=8407 RepID=UPI001AAD6EB9|nr:platelet basic protein-like isoform X1 [Rana temporaria]
MELRMFVLLSLLPAVFGVKHQCKTSQSYVSTRCQCIASLKFVPPRKFQNIEVIPQRSSCDQLEIIVIVNSTPKCIDPNDKEGKVIISCWKRSEGNTKKVKKCVQRKLKKGNGKKKKENK